MLVRPEGLWPASRPDLERQNRSQAKENIPPDKGDQND